MRPVRIGVVGLGKMGRYHVRCAGMAAGVELSGACDVDDARAADLPPDTFFTTELDALLERSDAIVLAVPTDRHGDQGARVLEADRHLLVEKPLAADAATCRELIAAAEARNLVLGVGHVERWNGAMLGLADRLGRPRFVEGHRLAAFDPRGTEVDVVLDLMIHDLDLVLRLVGAEPVRVDAVGVEVLTGRVDIASARLEFPGGELVNLTASRVSREPVRKLRLFQPDAYVSIDLGAQEAEVVSRDAASPGGFRQETVRAPEGHNPLLRELESFAAACRGEAGDLPAAEEGARAVAVAAQVLESIRVRGARWSGSTDASLGAPWADARS